MENLLGQILYDFICNLRALSFYNKANEFGHIWCEVVLVVKKVNDLLIDIARHVLDFRPVPLHSLLKQIEKSTLHLTCLV